MTTDETKDATPAEPVEVSPDIPSTEFDPEVVETSEDDGTSRAEGLDSDESMEEK